MLHSLTAISLVTQSLTSLTSLAGWSSVLCSLWDKRPLENCWLRLRNSQRLFVQRQTPRDGPLQCAAHRGTFPSAWYSLTLSSLSTRICDSPPAQQVRVLPIPPHPLWI